MNDVEDDEGRKKAKAEQAASHLANLGSIFHNWDHPRSKELSASPSPTGGIYYPRMRSIIGRPVRNTPDTYYIIGFNRWTIGIDSACKEGLDPMRASVSECRCRGTRCARTAQNVSVRVPPSAHFFYSCPHTVALHTPRCRVNHWAPVWA